jgi:hypothetical protein
MFDSNKGYGPGRAYCSEECAANAPTGARPENMRAEKYKATTLDHKRSAAKNYVRAGAGRRALFAASCGTRATTDLTATTAPLSLTTRFPAPRSHCLAVRRAGRRWRPRPHPGVPHRRPGRQGVAAHPAPVRPGVRHHAGHVLHRFGAHPGACTPQAAAQPPVGGRGVRSYAGRALVVVHAAPSRSRAYPPPHPCPLFRALPLCRWQP